MVDEDFLDILDDEPEAAPAELPWRILMVDDDPGVLASTTFALRDVRILGRPVELLEAGSAEAALEILTANPDLAAVLLDVVMETPDAGLRLVGRIREGLQRTALRIIIRTGQPGYAPELDVIHRYDINDYRQKAELDRTRLVTILTAAIRAYHQLELLEAHRAGLVKVVTATGSLMAERSLECFAEGVLTQICALSAVRPDGVLVVRLRRGDTGGPEAGAEEEDELRIIAAAGRFAGLAGRTLSEAPADVRERLGHLARCEPGAVGRDEQAASLRLVSPNGDELLVHFVVGRRLEETETDLLRLFATNVAVGFDNVRLCEDLQRAAFTAFTTRLPNIAGWRQRLEDGRGGAILLVRIPDLAVALALFGPEAATTLAREIAGRLIGRFPGAGRVAHVDPVTFGVVLRPDEGPAAVQALLEEPARLGDAALPLTAALAFAGEPGTARSNLDLALAALPAAQPGGPVSAYAPEVGRALASRFAILCEIGEALATDRMLAYFQPQVDMTTGAVVGAEALMRWRARDGRILPPGDFIDVAENSGLIVVHGRRLAEIAVADVARWNDRPSGFTVSLNVSPRELVAPGMADGLAGVVRDGGLPIASVTVEITESAFASDDRLSRRAIERLAEHGFRLSIDDFGTGHSSLARLASLPVAELKLDRSLCCRVDVDERARRLAGLVADLGGDLGFSVLAEGIEDEAQRAVLRALGCRLGQGYLFGRPVPAAEFSGRFLGPP